MASCCIPPGPSATDGHFCSPECPAPGKTTISRLAPPDVTLLTDEMSYIRRDRDGYRACGTPFAGELARVGENCSAPIGSLFFLKQGPENKIEPMAKSEAIRRLMRNILFFAEDAELVQRFSSRPASLWSAFRCSA